MDQSLNPAGSSLYNVRHGSSIKKAQEVEGYKASLRQLWSKKLHLFTHSSHLRTGYRSVLYFYIGPFPVFGSFSCLAVHNCLSADQVKVMGTIWINTEAKLHTLGTNCYWLLFTLATFKNHNFCMCSQIALP